MEPTAAAWRWRWFYWVCAVLVVVSAASFAWRGEWLCSLIVAGYGVVLFRRPKDQRVAVEYGYSAGRARH